jgi:hypothetical protein
MGSFQNSVKFPWSDGLPVRQIFRSYTYLTEFQTDLMMSALG